eukprot:gene49215-8132_t
MRWPLKAAEERAVSPKDRPLASPSRQPLREGEEHEPGPPPLTALADLSELPNQCLNAVENQAAGEDTGMSQREMASRARTAEER